MSVEFTRSSHALHQLRSSPISGVLLLIMILLGAWVVWFFRAEWVTTADYTVTTNANGVIIIEDIHSTAIASARLSVNDSSYRLRVQQLDETWQFIVIEDSDLPANTSGVLHITHPPQTPAQIIWQLLNG